LRVSKVILRTRILTAIPIILSLANIPHRGSSEGGQGELTLASKTDFWGAVLPIITLDYSARISSLLSVLSLSIYWTGFLLAISVKKTSNFKFILLTLLGSIGAIFSQQNLRDAFLLSFSILSFGLVEKFEATKVIVFRYLFLIPLIFAVTFKYPTSVAIVVLILFRFYAKRQLIYVKKFLLFLLSACFVIVIGISIDKGLANAASLRQGFVEQSVIYYDLAGFYCWSDDAQTRQMAIEALNPSLITQDPKEICLTHRPNAWVYLISGGNFIDKGVKAPLRQFIGAKDAKNATLLRSRWLNVILSDPADYIQLKFIAATQVITVGNPFLFSQLNFINKKFPYSFSDYVWWPISKILIIIGESYIFSVFVLILILLCLLNLGRFDQEVRLLIKFLLFVQVVNLIVLSIFYVSDEARYVFPIITISYLMLIKDIKITRNSSK